jgi:hypothetical protein
MGIQSQARSLRFPTGLVEHLLVCEALLPAVPGWAFMQCNGAPTGSRSLNREGAGWFCDVSSWSSNFLVLELYLPDTEVKENTEEGVELTAVLARIWRILGALSVKPSTAKLGKTPQSTQRAGSQCGYRRLGHSGVDEHLIHLNLDFSAKLIVRLIRIGC